MSKDEVWLIQIKMLPVGSHYKLEHVVAFWVESSFDNHIFFFYVYIIYEFHNLVPRERMHNKISKPFTPFFETSWDGDITDWEIKQGVGWHWMDIKRIEF